MAMILLGVGSEQITMARYFPSDLSVCERRFPPLAALLNWNGIPGTSIYHFMHNT